MKPVSRALTGPAASAGVWQKQTHSASALVVHKPIDQKHHNVTQYGEKTSWKENLILKKLSSRLCLPQEVGLGSGTAQRGNWKSACAGSS